MLPLDSAIRDWVVIPIVIMVILVGMGRHYAQILLKSSPILTEGDLNEARFKQIIQHALRLRLSGRYLHNDAFQRRKPILLERRLDYSGKRHLLQQTR